MSAGCASYARPLSTASSGKSTRTPDNLFHLRRSGRDDFRSLHGQTSGIRLCKLWMTINTSTIITIVSAGLTFKRNRLAFGHYQLSNWVPLTMLSHMLDCQPYQICLAGDHHLSPTCCFTPPSAIILFLTLFANDPCIFGAAHLSLQSLPCTPPACRNQ